MSEALDGFRNFINERLSSPLLGTYLVSWPICNYKIFLYAMSDLKVEEKIEKIDLVLFASGETIQHAFGLPFLIALVYVFLVPLPSTLALAFTLFWNQLNRRLRQYLESHALISKEEAKAILTEASKKQEELEDKVYRRDQQIDRLNQLLSNVQQQLDAEDSDKRKLKSDVSDYIGFYNKLVEINSNLAAAHKYRNSEAQSIAMYILGLVKLDMDGERSATMRASEFESLFDRIESMEIQTKEIMVGSNVVMDIPGFAKKEKM